MSKCLGTLSELNNGPFRLACPRSNKKRHPALFLFVNIRFMCKYVRVPTEHKEYNVCHWRIILFLGVLKLFLHPISIFE